MIRSRKILNHAKGQPCQLALPGFCANETETTVFAHLNGAAYGKGAGVKAHDIAGFFACHKCHMAYDLHEYTITGEELLRAVIGTWLILIRDGLIILPLDAPKPSAVKPRKPKSERKSIPARKTEWPSRPFPRREKNEME